MSGLYIGLGGVVGYDEYDVRANVGYQPTDAIKSVTVDKAINGVTLKDGDSANNLVTQLWACGKDEKPKDILYTNDDDTDVTIVSAEEMTGTEVDVYQHCTSSHYDYKTVDVYASTKQGDDLNDLKYSECCSDSDGIYLTNSYIPLPSSGYYYKADDGATSNDVFSDGDLYYPVKVYKKIPKSVITSDKATYLMSQSLNRSGHNAGGEMKMAYFHDFGNHVMAGLDLTGAVLSKNKRNVQVSQFNVNHEHPDLILKSGEDQIASAHYEAGSYTAAVTGDGTIKAGKSLTLSSNYEDFKADAMQANPGMHVTSEPIPETYLDVSNGDKEVSFEKGIFNPKLAFVVGGTYNGWFAGVRAGVSYNTGKIKAPDMTSSKSVSIASPLVGVQVMKKVSDNTNLYMTADWNVGDLRKSIDMNGIKSFKQSSYNISAGVQWKCNFMK